MHLFATYWKGPAGREVPSPVCARSLSRVEHRLRSLALGAYIRLRGSIKQHWDPPGPTLEDPDQNRPPEDPPAVLRVSLRLRLKMSFVVLLNLFPQQCVLLGVHNFAQLFSGQA